MPVCLGFDGVEDLVRTIKSCDFRECRTVADAVYAIKGTYFDVLLTDSHDGSRYSYCRPDEMSFMWWDNDEQTDVRIEVPMDIPVRYRGMGEDVVEFLML